MSKLGRPPKTDVQRRPCSLEGHSRRPVVLAGLVRGKSGEATHQRFRCSTGKVDQHTFRVRLVPVEQKPARVRKLAIRPYAPPEPCPEHPAGKVVRRGAYVSGKHSRQRYACTPPDWYEGARRSEDPLHAKHKFTPVLPRAHVEGYDACPHCAELRAIHRGDTVVARKHQAGTMTVANALARLGRGETYAEVSLWLQGEVRKAGPSPDPKNAWRRAADITEVFAPVLWEDWLGTARSKTDALFTGRRKAPRVVLLDDLPLFGKATRRRRQHQRFAVIAAAEAVPIAPAKPAKSEDRKAKHSTKQPRKREVQLRLLRALPTHSTDAYTLVLDEFVELYGFVPDVVVADGGKGIKPAVEALARRTGHDILFVTSTYHLKLQLGRAIGKARKYTPSFDPGSLATDLELGQPFTSHEAWEDWWDAFERRLSAQGVPRCGWSEKWKRDYHQEVCDQLDGLAPFPDVPRSTGALESLLTRFVKASMKRRASGFGNLPRTQQLLDGYVLHANGYFNDITRAVAALRDDATSGDPTSPGYVPPVRALSDLGAHRSLTDPDSIGFLLKARGL